VAARPAVLDGVAEPTRNLQQAVEVEVDAGAGLLGDLVLDRQIEVVGAEVERAERPPRSGSTDVRTCSTLSRKIRLRAIQRRYSCGETSSPPSDVP
jgi:hypothetical protein